MDIDDMSEEFHLGYQMTRFLYARDEVYASYICSLFSEENPTTNNHYFWIAELLESGFHGDVISTLLQGITYKHIITNQTVSTKNYITFYIQKIVDLFSQLSSIITEHNNSCTDIEPIFSLHHIHNDNPHDTQDDEYNIYDIFKLYIYTISKIVNEYNIEYIANINDNKHNHISTTDDELEMITTQLNNVKIEQSNKTNIDFIDMFKNLNIENSKSEEDTEEHTHDTKKYILLFSKLQELLSIQNGDTPCRITVYKGRSKTWKSSYPIELYPLLRKIQEYSSKSLLHYNDKKALYSMIVSIYTKHYNTKNIDMSNSYDMNEEQTKEYKKTLTIKQIYETIEIIQDFTLNILNITAPNIKELMEYIIYNPNMETNNMDESENISTPATQLFFEHIIYTNEDANNYINVSHITDMYSFDNIMISLLYLQTICTICSTPPSISDNEIQNKVDDINCYDIDYLNIESLRNTPYQTIVNDKYNTQDIPIHRILPYRALLNIHPYRYMFPLTKQQMNISQEKALYIREYEWYNYCVFTPVWKYRFEICCEEKNTSLSSIYDNDSCEFDFDNIINNNECFDSILLDFVEQPRHIKEGIIGKY